MIFGQAELLARLGEHGVVLRLRPVCDGRFIDIRLDVWAQVEQVAGVRPGGEEIAASREDVGCCAGFHIGYHLVGEVLRVGCVIDVDIRMLLVELGEHILR